MRPLLFSLMLLSGCAADYKGLSTVPADPACAWKVRPVPLGTSWYDASIDVVGKHISGLLLIKVMPDSSRRIVFTNAAGVKFLDFGFGRNHEFTVHHVLDQLDKKPVIRLLRKDFELMLGIPFHDGPWESLSMESELYYGVRQKKETHYFITGADCASLRRVESASKRKRKVSLVLYGLNRQAPDSIHLQHHTFAMQIALKKIIKE